MYKSNIQCVENAKRTQLSSKISWIWLLCTNPKEAFQVQGFKNGPIDADGSVDETSDLECELIIWLDACTEDLESRLDSKPCRSFWHQQTLMRQNSNTSQTGILCYSIMPISTLCILTLLLQYTRVEEM